MREVVRAHRMIRTYDSSQAARLWDMRHGRAGWEVWSTGATVVLPDGLGGTHSRATACPERGISFSHFLPEDGTASHRIA